jgi:hypothetical protein
MKSAMLTSPLMSGNVRTGTFVALKASRRRLDELGQLALTTAIISFVINTYVRKKFTMLPS